MFNTFYTPQCQWTNIMYKYGSIWLHLSNEHKLVYCEKSGGATGLMLSITKSGTEQSILWIYYSKQNKIIFYSLTFFIKSIVLCFSTVCRACHTKHVTACTRMNWWQINPTWFLTWTNAIKKLNVEGKGELVLGDNCSCSQKCPGVPLTGEVHAFLQGYFTF